MEISKRTTGRVTYGKQMKQPYSNGVIPGSKAVFSAQMKL